MGLRTQLTGLPKATIIKMNMQKMKKILFVSLLSMLAFACSESNNNSEQNKTPEKIETPVSKTKSKYVCPMYCEGGESEEAGKTCPVCGMDLVLRSDLEKENGHGHHDH